MTKKLMALTFVLGVATFVSRAAAQEPQLVINGAVPDAGGRTLTITGANFGSRLFVTLDLVPIPVQYSSDSQIVAAVPIDLIPPGTHLLTVSRGSSPADTGSFELTLGAVKPKPDEAAAKSQAPATLGPSGTEAAAKVGDRDISVGEVDQEWRRADPGGHAAVSRAIYEQRRRAADRMVTDELLAREAAARGVTTQALLDEEIPKRIVTMPESAVLSLYESLRDRTRGAGLDEMRPALRAWLERITERELAKMNYVEELMKVSTRAEVFLTPPRVQVDRSSQDVAAGPASAPVEIVVFGDLQNPEYARFAQVFGRVRDTFGEKVRLVFKHLPMLATGSVAAAQAAACANAQGKFWAYHDAVVARPRSLDSTQLKQLADDVRLDRRAFDACLDNGTFNEMIRPAVDEAERYAVRSSPSFLVNGWLAPPPPPFLPPFQFFTRLIEEELLRVSKARPAGR